MVAGRAGGLGATLSPDGTRLVYLSKNKLLTRRLNQPNASELPGTDGAEDPFFSPHGKWIGFFAQGKLQNGLSVASQPTWSRSANLPVNLKACVRLPGVDVL